MDKLEFRKLILRRVSVSPDIFKRELNKAIQSLDDRDIISLKTWCVKNFGKEYPEILVDSFKIIPYQ